MISFQAVEFVLQTQILQISEFQAFQKRSYSESMSKSAT